MIIALGPRLAPAAAKSEDSKTRLSSETRKFIGDDVRSLSCFLNKPRHLGFDDSFPVEAAVNGLYRAGDVAAGNQNFPAPARCGDEATSVLRSLSLALGRRRGTRGATRPARHPHRRRFAAAPPAPLRGPPPFPQIAELQTKPPRRAAPLSRSASNGFAAAANPFLKSSSTTARRDCIAAGGTCRSWKNISPWATRFLFTEN